MKFLAVFTIIMAIAVIKGQNECTGRTGLDAINMGRTILNGFCQVSLPNTDNKGRCVRDNMVVSHCIGESNLRTSKISRGKPVFFVLNSTVSKDLGTNNKLGERCINDESSNEICNGGIVDENNEEYRKAGCCMGRVVQSEGYRQSYLRILEGCQKEGRELEFESFLL